MKKILLLVVCLMLMLETSLAYTVTIRVGGIEGISTSEPGNVIQIIPKATIERWEVESGGVTITDNQFTMPNNNVVIKGIMPGTTPTSTTYTISYNANGGTGAPSSQTKTQGTALTLSSTVPTKSGSTFKGWSTSSTATTATYSAGGTFTTDATTVLYAVWEENAPTTYTISYNANGGTGAPSSQTKTQGIALTLSGTVPTNSGYVFNGWNTNQAGTGTDYAGGATYYANASVTLYAKWIESSGTEYTLTVSPNDGGKWADGTYTNKVYTGIAGDTVTIPSLTATAYINFHGNNGTIDGSATYGAEQESTINYSNGGFTLSGVGTWDYTTRTFTFGEGDATLAHAKWLVNVSNTCPYTPVRSGYTFVGWNSDATATTAIKYYYIPESWLLELYAIWE